MTLTSQRLCVFCGQKTNAKTREHVVPYWLLKLTGDPRRVVTFGQNYDKDKEPIRYSWSNFVTPACNACNDQYANLEGQVKPIIEALQRREALPVSAYIYLLDWLDKVRIGVWLARHMIENSPIEITPNFHISSRIAEKDRMLALYVFDSGNKGINLFGSDSLIFNDMPSCYGLRINDILLLNISSDFFCSRGCGLPYPNSMKQLMGGENSGMLKLEEFSYAAEITNPITNLKLFKPALWLYQPIKMPSSDPVFKAGYYGHTNQFDSRIIERTLSGNERQGALFRQYEDRIDILQNLDEIIGLDQVTGGDCAMLKDIAASIYEIQISQYSDIQYEWIRPAKPSAYDKAYSKLKKDNALELAEMYRNQIS